MHKKLCLYTDGGSRGNPGPAALGIVVADERGRIIEEYSEYLGRKTNNEAEYHAVIKALELAKRFSAREVIITLDSQLVVNQLKGKYKIKKKHLEKLVHRVREKEKGFYKVCYVHVRRENPYIQKADRLVNQKLNRVLKEI